MPINPDAQKRPLSNIAEDIQEDWPKPYFGAVPYIDAMSTLTRIDQKIGHDSAEEVVIRFLVNAKGWRGQKAREIKAELKAMIGQK